MWDKRYRVFIKDESHMTTNIKQTRKVIKFLKSEMNGGTLVHITFFFYINKPQIVD